MSSISVFQNTTIISAHNIHNGRDIWVDARFDKDGGEFDEVITSADARELGEKLIAAADDYDKRRAEYEESLKPKLPTESGLYIRGGLKDDESLTAFIVYRLTTSGQWSILSEPDTLPAAAKLRAEHALKTYGLSKLTVA